MASAYTNSESCRQTIEALLSQIPTQIGSYQQSVPLYDLTITVSADYWKRPDFPYRETLAVRQQSEGFQVTHTVDEPVYFPAGRGYRVEDYPPEIKTYLATADQVAAYICDLIQRHKEARRDVRLRIGFKYNNVNVNRILFPEIPGQNWFLPTNQWQRRLFSWGTESYMPTVYIGEAEVNL